MDYALDIIRSVAWPIAAVLAAYIVARATGSARARSGR